MFSRILSDKEKDRFLKELNLDAKADKILIKIIDKKACYFDGEEYHDLDLEIAKKYM